MKKILWLVWPWLKAATLSFILIFFIKSFLLMPVNVEGNSMKPTLSNHDFLMMTPYKALKRFDIIVFKTPKGETYIKRVIGLPGEKIAYHDDALYINNQKIKEDFLSVKNVQTTQSNVTADFNLKTLTGKQKIASNHYFVLGDNRRISKDSRTIGTISDKWVKGRILMRYYPINTLKWLN